ncbi:argonaute-like protein [Roridomyces roridus]|uniref:Argonaute-like protein n=1 Tax=Roridomyces roridus TaxID=1738132 RepID=A0AAD7CA78_9AGAR|nr:argonaute-like protein [Roridomyces roridus]
MPPRRAQAAPGPRIGVATENAHITTVGVKRTKFGTGGTPTTIVVNYFETTIPSGLIYHYDVVISPSEKTLPARLNMDLFRRLQVNVAPQIFTPRCVYDGRKNVFSSRKLPFENGSQEFDVTLADSPSSYSTRGPKVYKIKLTLVAEINPEVLDRFVKCKQSQDNTVLTAITALNVVIRMQPTLSYPFNVRSFFTDRETKDIGGGLELWRGYFQSMRPAIGRMLINVDISTGTMFKDGPLMDLCAAYLGVPIQQLNFLSDRQRVPLQRFISGIRVIIKRIDSSGAEVQTPRVIRKLSTVGASELMFQLRDGGSMSVAEYFRTTQNRPLLYPKMICCEVGTGALIPLELCTVLPGQLMRKQMPPEKTREMLSFASKPPSERLASITNALQILAYGQSEYVRQFGITVNEAAGPLRLNARILEPPTLRYGRGSRQPTITPKDGAWNMVDKKFIEPIPIPHWVLVVYETKNRFDARAAKDMMAGLSESCKDVGIALAATEFVSWENGQGRITEQLQAAGHACFKKTGSGPKLIVVVLPEGGNDIYTAVKHFGDITRGVPTQCLKSSKCFRAKSQYYANVCLKINVKLGGINTILDSSSRGASSLIDVHIPTMVMGADVVHPAPGSDGRPSFTSLVGSVDSNISKYVATSRVQTSRAEMIEDLKPMTEHILGKYMGYRQGVEKKAAPNSGPERIIFYRDGVSEGQFKQVLDQELPLIKEACAALKINPKITLIVVGKRHHVRFFPQNPQHRDRSGNCRAGTIVDNYICHPTEFDFYLQARHSLLPLLSHGGLLGTSRPAHYSVLYDENNLSPDALQSLSFALCHVYARSTRSVSIPAPVYYADIVCARAKTHYDPTETFDFSDSATQLDNGQADSSLEAFREGFKPLHANQQQRMYFS